MRETEIKNRFKAKPVTSCKQESSK